VKAREAGNVSEAAIPTFESGDASIDVEGHAGGQMKSVQPGMPEISNRISSAAGIAEF
jgi:hypothetical protein